MPLSYSVEPPALFLVRASGAVSYPGCTNLFASIREDQRLGPGGLMLVDGREASHVPSRAELRDIARDLKQLYESGIGATAIVTNKGFVYGVARMFAMFAELLGVNVGVFLTMEDGFEWLAEQKPPPFSPPELPPDDDALEGA